MYSDLALEHIRNPRNPGTMEGATHEGIAGALGEGPYMILWFEVCAGVIRRAAFATYECAAATAAGSITTALVTGRTVEQALRLTARDIDLVLGGLPEGKEHCPRLAAEAVRNAFEKKGEEEDDRFTAV